MPSRTKKDFRAIDFPLKTKRANIAEITLSGRYPEKGKAINMKSEMIVYVLKGKVIFMQGKSKRTLSKSSVVLVKTNQSYFWQPQKKVTLLVTSTPAWTPGQHEFLP